MKFRKTPWILALLFTMLLSSLVYTAMHTDIFTFSSGSGARLVVKVIDGDTIEVENGTGREKIRLIGIDTPETSDPRKKVECYGREASNTMKNLILGKRVRLEEDPTQMKEDIYGRSLRYVYLDKELINAYLIREGFAYEYTYKVPYLQQESFKQLEKNAREKEVGLWSPTSCAGKR